MDEQADQRLFFHIHNKICFLMPWLILASKNEDVDCFNNLFSNNSPQFLFLSNTEEKHILCTINLAISDV